MYIWQKKIGKATKSDEDDGVLFVGFLQNVRADWKLVQGFKENVMNRMNDFDNVNVDIGEKAERGHGF